MPNLIPNRCTLFGELKHKQFPRPLSLYPPVLPGRAWLTRLRALRVPAGLSWGEADGRVSVAAAGAV